MVQCPCNPVGPDRQQVNRNKMFYLDQMPLSECTSLIQHRGKNPRGTLAITTRQQSGGKIQYGHFQHGLKERPELTEAT